MSVPSTIFMPCSNSAGSSAITSLMRDFGTCFAPEKIELKKALLLGFAVFVLLTRIFKFDDLVAREIMVPRTDMVCLYVEKTLAENLKVMKEERYTRYPVAKGNKDNIIGVVNAKQFFLEYCDQEEVDLSSILRPAYIVSEITPVSTLLKKMQLNRANIAILIDEYGGTSGMLTIEDILEEIVGDIHDEFDDDEVKEIETIGENRYVVNGKVLINDINELLQSDIDGEDMETLGGWLYLQNSELKKGMEWQLGNISFKILERDKHRIRKVEISKVDISEKDASQE